MTSPVVQPEAGEVAHERHFGEAVRSSRVSAARTQRMGGRLERWPCRHTDDDLVAPSSHLARQLTPMSSGGS